MDEARLLPLGWYVHSFTSVPVKSSRYAKWTSRFPMVLGVLSSSPDPLVNLNKIKSYSLISDNAAAKCNTTIATSQILISSRRW